MFAQCAIHQDRLPLRVARPAASREIDNRLATTIPEQKVCDGWCKPILPTCFGGLWCTINLDVGTTLFWEEEASVGELFIYIRVVCGVTEDSEDVWMDSRGLPDEEGNKLSSTSTTVKILS